MPKLVLRKDAHIIKDFEFKKSKSIYLIGSDEDNDFIIKDQKVAIKHLKIESIQDAWYVEDLNTQSGTSLNGKPLVNTEQIVQGDEIALGDHHLIFENLNSDNFENSEPYFDVSEDDTRIDIIGEDDFDNFYNEMPDTQEEQLHVTEQKSEFGNHETSEFYQFEDLEPETATIESVNSANRSQETPNGYSGLSLLAIYGPYIGNKYPLKYGENKIGRDNTLNDIVIRTDESGVLDPSISRRHATVQYKNGKFFVSDKRSKTRTFVNQNELSATDEHPVFEGDEIEIVSDQKSTIFRVVKDEHEILKPPRKAGIWWIRNSYKLGYSIAALFAILSVLAIVGALKTIFIDNSSIDKLDFIQETWFQDKGLNQADNLASLNLAAEDLNGDNSVDIVYSNSFGNIQILDGITKKEIWRNSQIQIIPGSSIRLADLNQNSLPDLVLYCSDMRMRALDGSNGAEIWLSPLLGEEPIDTPALADFNNDGIQDILIANRTGVLNLGYGKVNSVNWQTIETGVNLSSVPTAYDVNQDGIMEIFVSSDDGKLLIFSGKNGELKTIHDFKHIAAIADNRDLELNHAITAPAVIMHSSEKGKPVLIFSTAQGENLGVMANSFSKVFYEKLHYQHNLSELQLSPAIGNVTGSDTPQAVLISNQILKVFTVDDKKTNWEYFATDNEYFVSSAVLTDLNKDGSAEVITSTISGAILVLDGRNGKLMGRIESEQNPVASPLLVADLGGDGSLDILCRRKDGHIYKIQTNSTVAANTVIWGQRFNNATNTCELTYQPENASSDFIFATISGLVFLVIGGFTHSAHSKRMIKMKQKSPPDIT